MLGEEARFEASATTTGCTSTPTFRWSFGDGGSASVPNTTHVYTDPGLYTVALRVTVTGASSPCDLQGTVTVLYTTTANDAVTVSTIAGSPGKRGSADGQGTDARFSDPSSVVPDRSGNLFVGDFNNTIRKITPGGLVSTIAGSAGSAGFVDGDGAKARFHDPHDLAVDGQGIVYVADQYNNAIRKVTQDGRVSTLAGGTSGFADGQGRQAKFSYPTGVAVEYSGVVYVADSWNHVIRRIEPDGSVRTIAGKPGVEGGGDGPANQATFTHPNRLTLDTSGNLLILDRSSDIPSVSRVRRLSPTGDVTTIASVRGTGGNLAAMFDGIAVDASNEIFVTNWADHSLVKISQNGTVRVIAGLPGVEGSTDGDGENARFDMPSGIAFDANGDLYLADESNLTIRRIVGRALRAAPTVTPQTVILGKNVTFAAGASRGTPPYRYAWTFSDDMAATTEESPLRSFSTPGRYTGTVVVTDAKGATATGSVEVTVVPVLVVEASAHPTEAESGTPLVFTATVSGGAPPYRYEWTFSDGKGGATTESVTRVFEYADTYAGTVEVVDTVGNRVTSKVSVTVRGTPKPPLLLSNGKVGVRVAWRNQYSGETGTATPISKGANYGYFYFSQPTNPEVFVKVLDFGSTRPFLLFWAGLTDFEYTVTFTNQSSGRIFSVTKPAGSTAGGANTTDLPYIGVEPEPTRFSVPRNPGKGPGLPLPGASTDLLLAGGQVTVSVTWWSQYSSQSGIATALPQDDQFGFFYFSDAGNPEVFVKVLDWGTSSPFLLFAAGLTDYEYTVTYRNMKTGQKVIFTKPSGGYGGYVDGTSMGH
jgi:PKD repeat protein